MTGFSKWVVLVLGTAVSVSSLSLQAGGQPGSTPSEGRKASVSKTAQGTTAEKPTREVIQAIKDEGQNRSEVMNTLGYLTDVIGPRLTGSPGLKRAGEWTRDRLSAWGLENAQLEPWGEFGRGWSLKRFSAQVVEPQAFPLIGYPKAWSPGLPKASQAPFVVLDAQKEADLARYKGTLKGAIVLVGSERKLSARFEPLASRLSDSDLLNRANAGAPAQRKGSPRRPSGEFTRKRMEFLLAEGALALVEPSTIGDGGTLFVSGAQVPAPEPDPKSKAKTKPDAPSQKRVSAWDKDAPKTLPQVVLAVEHYNRLLRMINQGEVLKGEFDLAVEFHDDDLDAYNTVAEIPGTDLKEEVVMLGGHLDSWHSGTGATDNAAGVAVAMEAVRILKALDLKPRRTIRIALWTGEEQGLLGSKAYANKHFGPGESGVGADRDRSQPNAEHKNFSAYFNLDNGTGKIRGVYLQGNEAVRPLFREWLQPFETLGASTLTLANTGGTDHLSFDELGLPGFQFIQDPVEYSTRTHHSNQDVFDRIQADDMKQASIVMAAFVYQTAMRDEKLPRKPRPKSSPSAIAAKPAS